MNEVKETISATQKHYLLSNPSFSYWVKQAVQELDGREQEPMVEYHLKLEKKTNQHTVTIL